MIKSATFSADRKRRFDLVRDWRDEIGAPQKTVLFVPLNPSKAGERDDDATVRKMIGFSRRWGYGRLVVCNLNPIVSTDPWKLPPWNGSDYANQATLNSCVKDSDLIVPAWGSIPKALADRIGFPELVYRFCNILVENGKIDLYCIGTTRRGDPLHPSRARYTLQPVTWKR